MKYKDDVLGEVIPYLKKKNQFINFKEFSFELKSHPEYPSLISVVETFEGFGIKYSLYQISIEEIDEHEDNFLSLINQKESTTIAFIRKTKKGLKVGSHVLNSEDLKDIWSGIILVTEKLSAEKKSSKFKLILKLFFPFLLILSSSILQNVEYSTLLFYFFPVIGIYLSLINFDNYFRIYNSFPKVCMVKNEDRCASVQNSDKWKIFKKFNLSDWSLSFFLSQFLVLYFLSILERAEDYLILQLHFLVILLFLVAISLYFQKFVVKTWCPICLGIGAILILEFFYLMGYWNNLFHLNYEILLFFVVFLLLTHGSWLFVKKNIESLKSKSNLLLQQKQFLNKYQNFKALLDGGKFYNCDHDYLQNRNHSHFTIHLITDPFCDYCKVLHNEIMNIIDNSEQTIKLNLIFNVDIKKEFEVHRKIYRDMLRFKISTSNEKFLRFIHEWYKDEDKSLLERNVVDIDSEIVDSLLKNQYNWCIQNGINYTPAIIIKGRLLPEIYNVKDLRFFIAKLAEDPN